MAKMNLNGKKGYMDGVYAMLIGMVLLVIIPICTYLVITLKNGLVNSTNVTTAIDGVTEVAGKWSGSADTIYAMLFFGLWITAMVVSYFIDTHPIFMVAGIVVMVVMLRVAMFFINAYYDTMATSGSIIGTQLMSMPITDFIGRHFAELNLGLFGLCLVIFYAKYR